MPRSSDSATAANEAEQRLLGWLDAAQSLLIGFSGGVDSAYLACVAVEALGSERVLAVIGRSSSYPAVQWTRARELAEQFGIPLLEVDTDEVEDPRYVANPTNRCYFCKSELWHVLTPIARERGLDCVVDGTNADDMTGHRPGAGAAREQGVRSPLAEIGMTKAEIRERSRARGIPTWNQPASPCLSSRIPYGTEVTSERLRLVERAEDSLRELGIHGDMRVRLHGPLARVELGAAELDAWLEPERAQALQAAVTGVGFERVAIDLNGFRSGSLNFMNVVEHKGAKASADPQPGVDAVEGKRQWGPAFAGAAREASADPQPGVDAVEGKRHWAPAVAGATGVRSVEAHGTLAVLSVRATGSIELWTGEGRHAVLAIARTHGFTHVALELHQPPALDPALLRDQPAR